MLSPSSIAANPAFSGRPPKSVKSKASQNPGKESVKTGHSIKSPDIQNTSVRGESPSRPMALAPLSNPPQLPANPSNPVLHVEPSQGTGSAYSLPETTPEKQQTQIQNLEKEQAHQEEEKFEEIKITWTPLLDKTEKADARDYGYSFGSKKVAMGPGFMNLRFMNHCLARAIKRHLDFSQGTHWFL